MRRRRRDRDSACAGTAKILGILCDTTSEWCAPAVDAINTWYRRPDVPVGTLKGPGNAGGSARWFGESFNRFLAERCPNRLRSGHRAPDVVRVYRTLLAGAPDGSVAIASVGNTTNLRDLLESRADDLSPLGGIELVKKKVRVLSVMGGTYPSGPKEDPNLFGDFAASRTVLAEWPTPIMFSGIEIGDRIATGARLNGTPENNPVRIAFALWDDHFRRFWAAPFDPEKVQAHPSYDQTAVLYAVRGLRDYWTAKTDGCNRLRDDGSTEWRPEPHRGHGYLVERMPPDRLASIIEELMIEPPAVR